MKLSGSDYFKANTISSKELDRISLKGRESKRNPLRIKDVKYWIVYARLNAMFNGAQYRIARKTMLRELFNDGLI